MATPSRPNNQPFRLLSLDGGGIRGAFIAACLAEFERQLQRPITDYFDLIAGTSTGGIIALALALGEPAIKIKQFYESYGPQIFTRKKPLPMPIWVRTALGTIKRVFPAIDSDALFQSKYDTGLLKQALVDMYGEKTLEDAKHCRLVIPAIDLINGQTITFKTPHQPGFIRDRHFKAVDVALATGAAPTFFPHAVIQPGSAYCDGGLWANNPSVVAIAEAIKIQQVCQRPMIDPIFEMKDIFLLSIGTGKPRYFANPDPKSNGLLWWGPKLIDVMFGSQSQGTQAEANYILGDRCVRLDFEMPNGLWPLDGIENLSALFHIGTQKAVENYSKLKPTFFSSPKEQLQFFDA